MKVAAFAAIFALVSLPTCGYLAFRRFRRKVTGARSHTHYGKPDVKHDTEEAKDSVPPEVVGEPRLLPPKTPAPVKAESDIDLLGLQGSEQSGFSNGDQGSIPPADTDAEVELDHLINSIVNSHEGVRPRS